MSNLRRRNGFNSEKSSCKFGRWTVFQRVVMVRKDLTTLISPNAAEIPFNPTSRVFATFFLRYCTIPLYNHDYDFILLIPYNAHSDTIPRASKYCCKSVEDLFTFLVFP